MSIITEHRLSILSGILIGTSYIPFPPWALFFCLVPLFVFWNQKVSSRKAFVGGWVAQFILSLIGFHWIAYTAVEFGHFPWWGGALTLLGFCMIAHLHFPAAGWCARQMSERFGIRGSWQIFLSAILLSLFSLVFPMIFPWHFGYPWLWAKLPGAQFADVIGFEGLNVATILINGFIAAAVIEWRSIRRKRIALRYVTAGLGLLLALNLAGLGRDKAWQKTDSQLKVLTVQGNIGNFDKIMAEKGRGGFQQAIVQTYMDLSRSGLAQAPGSELMLWPETAFPSRLDQEYANDFHSAKLRDFVRSTGVPLLTGAYSYSFENEDTYNAIFYIDSQGTIPIPPYRKSILLVFGETFPFSEYLPYMDKLFPNMGSFGRGLGPQILNTDSVRFGPQICYEGLYPWFSASLARQGAQIFANVTNDSWFGRHFEPYQHLYMTIARAIEFRRPLVRSTNTGITTVALASGEILQESPLHQEWVHTFEVRYLANPPHTLYEKFVGFWPWILAFGLVLLLVLRRERTQST